MKFLRLAFYVLIAQLVLSGCAGEGVEETSSSSSSEITFDAYVNRNASSRSGIVDNTFLQGGEFNAGFGVFARYKHTKEENSSLMLMDNEYVTWQENHWGYTNTRYWPNEGFVDFYAFAPHSEVPILERPDPDKADTYIFFPSYINPVDLVWANAKNQTKADNPVKFTFSHALARFGFDITANNLNDGEVITVSNVQLYCESNTPIKEHIGVFVMAGYLNLENGDWILADKGTRWYYSWTPTGNDGENLGGYKEGEGPKLKITGAQLDQEHKIITNSPKSFIFIIPQEKREPVYLEITYTVKQGDFEETVTVKKNLLEVLDPSETSNPSFEFKEGKAYVFHLILSLDPINFSITPKVEDWK